jgi:hypothetical protein
MLELILKGVDKPQYTFYYQNPRYNEDYYQGYDHSGLKLVFNADQSERKNRIPKEKLEDMHELNYPPFLFDFRLIFYVAINALRPPRDIIHAAQCVYVKDDEIGGVVIDEGNGSGYHFDEELEFFMHYRI